MNVLLSADSAFQQRTFGYYYSFIIKMTREQGEALSQRICNFYCYPA